MTSRTTVRTVVTLVTAICVVTMFAGSAAALINVNADGEEEEDGLINLDTGLESEASESGGGGAGGLSVDTDQGGAGGVGSVNANADDPSVNVNVTGQGGPADSEVTAGFDCTIGPGLAEAENPTDECGPIGALNQTDGFPGLDDVPLPPEGGVPVSDGASALSGGSIPGLSDAPVSPEEVQNALTELLLNQNPEPLTELLTSMGPGQLQDV